MPATRIQKVLAAAGVASRRAIEQMVRDGRITVNGRAITDLPCFVESGDEICVDGRRVSAAPGETVVFLLNKPKGMVCTQRDPAGRRRAVDLIPPIPQRVYCAGRLDADSTGLVVLTNDGELTNYLTHPRYGVSKTYVVEVDGRIGGDAVERLKSGVWLDGTKRSAWVKVLRRSSTRSVLQVRICEGRNRQVRRILSRLGYRARRLKRTAIGPLTDRGLKGGAFRQLTAVQIARLRRAGEDKDSTRPARAKKRR
ncbi:MAG: rRNA pseudouridine synthase [Phycisphaerae bacterium]|nr:rRNA pseudouridine synthase [Phycisphaerae bacterium]